MTGLDPEHSALADAMNAVRSAAEALHRLRAVESEEDYGVFLDWVMAKTPGEREYLTIGLLILSWNCGDPDIEAAYLLEAEVNFPAPSELVPMDQLRAGDWIRLIDHADDITSDHQILTASVSGADVTLTFEDSSPITQPRDIPVLRVVSERL